MHSSSMAVLIKSDSDPLPHPRAGMSEEKDGEDEETCSAATVKEKKKAASSKRRVSFPVDEHLVTGYVEPPNPWEKAIGVTTPEVVTAYVMACNRYNLQPLNRVIQQLQITERLDERVESLDLQGEKLTGCHMEALEEIFKRVQFVTVNLENTSLDDESSLPLFDMLEYYDSVRVLNISRNKNISMQGWQSCCRMIKRTRCLEELIASGIPMEEENLRILQRTLKLSPSLLVLRLDNCGLSGRHLTTLMTGLKPNKVLRELHLADNRINGSDGYQVAQLLRSNLQLRLLNLSGNQLEDQGISHLADGLGDQNQVQVLLKLRKNRRGLRSLLLRNNKITSNSATSLAKALMENNSLEILDLGNNNINNEGIYLLKETLMRNRCLTRLKLNDCRITCEGAVALAEYIAENPKIQELDLRDNCIRLGGLLALVQSMKVNQSVTKLELDMPSVKEIPSEAEQRRQLLLQVSEYSDRNFDISEKKKELDGECEENEDDENDIISEPVSKLLSLWTHPPLPIRPSSVMCRPPITVSSAAASPPEPGSWQAVRGTHHYLRSPQPSPSCSPIPSPTRNRFHVTRVFQEVDSSPPTITPSSLSATPIVRSASLPPVTMPNNGNRVKFIVTPVIDVNFEEPSARCSTASSTSSVSSPLLEEPKGDAEESSDNDSVFLDQSELIAAAAASPPSSSSSLFTVSPVTLDVEESEFDASSEMDNCNGDRDSGIYLLDLNCDDLDTVHASTRMVPNEEDISSTSNSSNNELIDRLLQDTSAAANRENGDLVVTLVDVDVAELWTNSSPGTSDSSGIGVDFLTESGSWESTEIVNGDLINFTETLEPVMWKGERDSVTPISNNINNNNNNNNNVSGNCNSDSFDGGESNGSSDSGITEVDDVVILEDARIILETETESEKSSLDVCCNEKEAEKQALMEEPSRKHKNGYRNASSQQSENGIGSGKRTRTPGCAGSKDAFGGHWSA